MINQSKSWNVTSHDVQEEIVYDTLFRHKLQSSCTLAAAVAIVIVSVTVSSIVGYDLLN